MKNEKRSATDSETASSQYCADKDLLHYERILLLLSLKSWSELVFCCRSYV